MCGKTELWDHRANPVLMTCSFAQVVNYGVGGMNGLHEDSVVTEKGHVATQLCHYSLSAAFAFRPVYFYFVLSICSLRI